MGKRFDYTTAFSRNIGWITAAEQEVLRTKRVAIAGLGGVGGSHLLTLTRLGIGKFHISDHDTFELANFNRQRGATLTHLDRPKVDVLAEMALDIDPALEVRKFPDGIGRENVKDFIAGVDIYVDGLDFFAVAARREVFGACAELGVPAVTAAPLGMGAALLNFLPGGMTFEEYFRLEGHPEDEQLLRFFVGLAPAGLQGGYLVEPSTIDLAGHRGPSTSMGCELCAGVAASQALKILLRRGKVLAAPHALQFDAYANKAAHTWRPGGNQHPLQRLALHVGRKRILGRTASMSQKTSGPEPDRPVIDKILDEARWAPSGDNTQPWRFEIRSETELTVHGNDTRDHVVYDLQGHASQLALGALLESIAIAASRQGLKSEVERRTGLAETRPTFDIEFLRDAHIETDPLYPYLRERITQRRALSTRPLGVQVRTGLEAALPTGFNVLWLTGFRKRIEAAKMLFANAGIRLTMREAYEVHREVIEWGARYSETRIPEQALGVDPVTAKIMQWAMKSWSRVEFMNRFLGGTLLPRLQLDLIPGLACGAHFVLLAEKRPTTLDDFVAAGRALQRFWLTAARLGLYVQPEMTPLIFHEYVAEGLEFSKMPDMFDRAAKVSDKLKALLGEKNTQLAVFMGRIGYGPRPDARSIRLPLDKLSNE